MPDLLSRLQTLNSNLAIHSVHDREFRRFGRVVDFDAAGLIAAAEREAMPEAGCKYSPDLATLETANEFLRVQSELRGQGSCQIGLCWGYNRSLNCLEYHRSSEHNVAVTDLVLLLAGQQNLEGFDLPSGNISGFLVPQGTTIEVYATTLHFCPCQVADGGFRCIVILSRGTNLSLEDGPRPKIGDGRLLWAKDKWLIAHPTAPHVARGAYPGLHGENVTLQY